MPEAFVFCNFCYLVVTFSLQKDGQWSERLRIGHVQRVGGAKWDVNEECWECLPLGRAACPPIPLGRVPPYPSPPPPTPLHCFFTSRSAQGYQGGIGGLRTNCITQAMNAKKSQKKQTTKSKDKIKRTPRPSGTNDEDEQLT